MYWEGGETVKEAIKAARDQAGLTQAELAEKLHITQSAVSHWEQGIGMPSAKQIPLIAEALKTTVAKLFGEKAG